MKTKSGIWGLMVGAIGVVYGDIGTSPLYAVKSCFLMGGLGVTEGNVLGLTSLFFWTLVMVVTVKYVNIVMQVDNHGEGGILALSSLCGQMRGGRWRGMAVILGIIGAALFFGDGVITPAISVLGALEGIKLVYPQLENEILLLSVVVLSLLFLIQRNGSGRIGRYFGPVMMVWFITLGVLGVNYVVKEPRVLKALNPYYGIKFLCEHGVSGLLTMGGVILVVTGAEALYADMGHFGRKSIRLSWVYIVFPALVMNYFGQGALLLGNVEGISNPFYLLAPGWMLKPLILLATVATVIASQSVISGVFSMSWQGIMLNYLPRMRVMHTSVEQIGQVYVPIVNYLLYCGTLAVVLKFRSSDNLSVAYGLGVSGVMLITTVLVGVIAMEKWRWGRWRLVSLFGVLVSVDVAFLGVNLVKLMEGAWFTLMITGVVGYVIWVWRKGNAAIEEQKRNVVEEEVGEYVDRVVEGSSVRIPGVGVFMSRFPGKVPNALRVHVEHNKILHEKLLFISILTEGRPRVPTVEKYWGEGRENGVYYIEARYGFKEVPDLNRIVHWAEEHGMVGRGMGISYFFSRSIPVATESKRLTGIGESLYIFLVHNSMSAYEFYRVPHEKVVELGVRYQI